MIGRAGGVGIVLRDPQVGLVGVVVQAVQDVRRFALGGSDDLDPVWPVSSRDVGVEHRAGIDPVFRVHVAPAAGAAAGTKILSVGGGGCAVIPECRQRMFVMRVDDRGARGDVVVVVDVPLRDVDQVMVGQAVRGVGHARQTQVRAVGQDGSEQRRLVGGRVACAQMGEAVGEPCPGIDVSQDLGDAHARQQAFQARCKQARRLRRRRFGARDVEFSCLDLHAIQFAARGTGRDKLQALVQQRSARRDIAIGVGLAVDPAPVCGVVDGQEIVLERAVVAAAGHPDVAPAQSVAQCCEDGGLVQPAIGRAGREDQLAPLGRKERRRRPFGEHPCVRRAEQFHGGQHGIVRRARLEPECFQEPRAEAAEDRVFLGRGDQDVLVGDVGGGLDHRQGTLEPGHADLTIDHAHAVLAGRLRLLECEDRASEQQQRLGDVAFGRVETPLVLAARFGEQRAHVFFEHGERRVWRSATWATRIALRRTGSRSAMCCAVMMAPSSTSRPSRAGWIRRARSGLIPRPRTKSSRSSSSIMFDGAGDSGESRDQAKRDRRTSGSYASNPTSFSLSASVRPDASVWNAVLRARTRASSPMRSRTVGAGMSTRAARRCSSIARTIGSPRSVAHAASAPTRRQVRQPANPKRRIPRAACSSAVCSRRVWSRSA